MRSVWDGEEVAEGEPLWRYFRADRFIATLKSSTLHFAAATQFEDPFEGAVAIQSTDLPVDPRYADFDYTERAFAELRRLTKLNCWHRAEYESDAMWKLYAAARKGVAIRTTAGRLRTALKPFRLAPKYGEEDPFWGNVRYFDLMKERLRIGAVERFFVKHRAFEWEREFRVAITLEMAEQFGVQVPEFGIEVDFDPDSLIESVYLGPALNDSEREQIVASVKGANLDGRLILSSLLARPRFI